MTTISTSTSAFYERGISDMASLRAQAEKMQASLSSQQRLSRSSDDPVAASRLRQLARADTYSGIDKVNSERASTDLQLTDGALSSLADYVSRAKELTVQAANGTLTDAERKSIGQELAAIRENVIQLANSRNAAGGALFGGQSAGDAYGPDPATGVFGYRGTSDLNDLPLGDGQTVTPGLTGPQVFEFSGASGTTDLMTELKALSDTLIAGGAAAQTAANAGIDMLNSATETISTAQSVIGSRMAWLDLTDTRRTDLATLRSSEETDVGGVDTATVYARLQQTMTVLEASQASFVKLANLSLFSLIN
jgi:flagellar hook-associated protein 3 FlgL